MVCGVWHAAPVMRLQQVVLRASYVYYLTQCICCLMPHQLRTVGLACVASLAATQLGFAYTASARAEAARSAEEANLKVVKGICITG